MIRLMKMETEMRASVLLVLVALAGCGEPKREVTVEVETDRNTVGPISTTKSVETRTQVDAKTAEAVNRELHSKRHTQP